MLKNWGLEERTFENTQFWKGKVFYKVYGKMHRKFTVNSPKAPAVMKLLVVSSLNVHDKGPWKWKLFMTHNIHEKRVTTKVREQIDSSGLKMKYFENSNF